MPMGGIWMADPPLWYSEQQQLGQNWETETVCAALTCLQPRSAEPLFSLKKLELDNNI